MEVTSRVFCRSVKVVASTRKGQPRLCLLPTRETADLPISFLLSPLFSPLNYLTQTRGRYATPVCLMLRRTAASTNSSDRRCSRSCTGLEQHFLSACCLSQTCMDRAPLSCLCYASAFRPSPLSCSEVFMIYPLYQQMTASEKTPFANVSFGMDNELGVDVVRDLPYDDQCC